MVSELFQETRGDRFLSESPERPEFNLSSQVQQKEKRCFKVETNN